MTGFSRIAPLLAALLLASCASQVPVNIREAPANNPLPDEVRTDTRDYGSREVRWGGEILAVENLENATLLTVLARPLTSDGEPRLTDTSQGRFMARVPVFLDPEVYSTGRDITVRGTLAGSETRQVGDYAYRYPVVEASDWYLWAEPIEYGADYPWWYYDPWYYDPWYRYPWYPYYPRRRFKD